MLHLALVLAIESAKAKSSDCSARWSIDGILPGMLATDLVRALPDAPQGPFTVGNLWRLVNAGPIAGFKSKVSVSVCADDLGIVTLLMLDFSGTKTELQADKSALLARWSRSARLPLGVTDAMVDGDVTGSYLESVFDECGWNALLSWSENKTGITGLSVGIRTGTPEFVEATGNKYRVVPDVLSRVEWQYARCRP
jgi:hypothetical protein